MPVIAIPIEELNRRLGRDLTSDEMEAHLDQLGCDLDGFAKLRRYRCRPSGALIELNPHEELPGRCPETLIEGKPDELWEYLGDVDVVKMDLLPVRPDIFDAGGLTRAIKGLLEVEMGLPEYEMGAPSLEVNVDASVANVRPQIGCAVMRGLKIDDVGLRMLMKLQENLHWALARDRKLASIGVYDLASIKGPVTYTTVGREEITFVPLQTIDGKAVTPEAILSEHPKGVAYAHLLKDFQRVPLLLDKVEQVLSMPPIINSHETRVTTETTDVFIDVTGISDRVVTKCLHTLVTSMLELFPGSRAERVQMHFPGMLNLPESTVALPSMATESFVIDVEHACRRIGIDIDRERAIRLLMQMRHHAEAVEDNASQVRVTVAPYRNDIMHEVDLIEDLAIAYGYQNIVPVLVPNMTVAQERPERVLANRTRNTMTGLGFFEVMSLLLSNPEEQYELMNVEDPGDAVLIENPASVEQSLMRTMVLPQLLRLFALNRGQGLPQRMFEVDDVVVFEDGTEHPSERLHLAGGILDTQVGFSDIKAITEAIAHEIGMPLTYQAIHHPAFLEGRVAQLLYQDEPVGIVGEVHPSVLEKLRLVQPLAVFEVSLQPLLPESDLYAL
ncbi:MAG: phenylalanine--tRNA ligase subunit beta [Myxococcales bacterium]|nr:phenylalanine--tRNA ligase subunit beta [Myxococcales bacterium]